MWPRCCSTSAWRLAFWPEACPERARELLAGDAPPFSRCDGAQHQPSILRAATPSHWMAGGREHPANLAIDAGDARARIGQPVRELGVVGEDEESRLGAAGEPKFREGPIERDAGPTSGSCRTGARSQNLWHAAPAWRPVARLWTPTTREFDQLGSPPALSTSGP